MFTGIKYKQHSLCHIDYTPAEDWKIHYSAAAVNSLDFMACNICFAFALLSKILETKVETLQINYREQAPPPPAVT